VRVVSGRFGGRPLVAPHGRATRPTPERVREALFSILGDIDQLDVLDLFAGSGALGIEALSRGARAATFVDSSHAALDAIRRNLRRLEVDGEVRGQSAAAFLQQARDSRRQYDLVFLDPPYGHAARLGRSLGAALAPVLGPGARVVAESDRRAPLQLDLTLLDERRYGDTLIRIYSPDSK
jgi:16S rRNA (guanine966-N2)-methyltransferase